MLKFRRTRSSREKRDDLKKKIVEGKIQMEWAWMPLAAVMNEKATDLIYWVPPIYTTKILPKRQSSKVGNASFKENSIRRKLSRRSTIRISSNSTNGSSTRKRKLCQRRSKLHATKSVLGDMEPDVEFAKTSLVRQGALESGSVDVDEHKSESEKSADESIIPFPEVRKTNSRFPPKSFNKKTTNNTLKLKNASTLLKLLEKLAELYGKRNKPIVRSQSKVKSRNRKRPSVKLYRIPSQRSQPKKNSMRLNNSYQYFPSFGNYGSIKVNKCNTKKKLDTTSKISNADIKENNSLNGEQQIAQLQLALTVLANFFEKKIESQNNEIEIMKMKLQRQEKVLKHSAQLTLQMKNHVTTINARLDNIELIGSKMYKQEEYFMPYIHLESLNEENTSDSCPESYDESVSVSRSSSKRRIGKRPKLYASQSREPSTESFEIHEKYRTSIKLQLNGDSFTD